MGTVRQVPGSHDDAVKYSETLFVALSYDPVSDTSIVLARPRTGRTHQIRVHLAALGHPIANDVCYNPRVTARERAEDGQTALESPPEETRFQDFSRFPSGHRSGIFLHALQYAGPGWSYQADLPWWFVKNGG